MLNDTTPTLQRKLVWSGWMRLAHALIALPVIVLITTAWLLRYTTGINQAAIDYHYIAGALLAMGLILRLGLLFFDRSTGRWQHLVPNRSQLPAMSKMLRFYLSFARMPLPKWYAHNPFWLPIYSLMLIVLAIMTISGFLMASQPILMGLYLPNIHSLWAPILTVIVMAHIVTAILHDLKGCGADISAMINGYRIFQIEKQETGLLNLNPSVSVDDLLGSRKRSNSSKSAKKPEVN
ncbi:MAG: cytochrome b/b6 domain-containing protein [Gammaproteobacteria bacterium]